MPPEHGCTEPEAWRRMEHDEQEVAQSSGKQTGWGALGVWEPQQLSQQP